MITVSSQYVYTTVFNHLKNGGRQSAVPHANGIGSKCLYRGPDGAKCFIGLLIPDDKFEHEWDNGKSALDLVHEGKIIVEGKNKDRSGYFLKRMQQMHDAEENWDTNSGEFIAWKELKEWAKYYNVQVDNC